MKKKQLLIIIEQMFRLMCKHTDAHDDDHSQYDHNPDGTSHKGYFDWRNCNDCKLRLTSIELTECEGSPRVSPDHVISRDICFLIWHEGYIELPQNKNTDTVIKEDEEEDNSRSRGGFGRRGGDPGYDHGSDQRL